MSDLNEMLLFTFILIISCSTPILTNDDTINRNKLTKRLIKTENGNGISTQKYHESMASEHHHNNLSIDLESQDNSQWIKNAVKDIAYYLRSHKFNEYDRRYNRNDTNAEKTYHKEFPKPPLRSLHWEVHMNCDASFLQCIEYLHRKIVLTSLRREDDTSIVIIENQRNATNHTEQIKQIDIECQRAFSRDFKIAPPFAGPLERYQWRTTASYYMCWYTMNEIDNLKHIDENCDNFANCLSLEFGAKNNDPRADDSIPFACAQYSFCPDPCCVNKHLLEMDFCWSNVENPCFNENPASQRKCFFNRSNNTEFSDIILNRWNVSCNCPLRGYKWSSLYGICIDIDECSGSNGGIQQCTARGEACLNSLGSFTCVCRWGYKFNKNSGKCIKNEIISNLILQSGNLEKTEAINQWKRFLGVTMTILGRSNGEENQCSIYTLVLILLFNFLICYVTVMN